MSNEIKHFYVFGEFRFSPEDKCLWRKDELMQLSPKALEVLDVLVERSNEVVSREEILERVWHDTFVDENNLTVAISNLRKVFKASSSNAKFIQTVPKKGYRFLAGVETVFDDRNVNGPVPPGVKQMGADAGNGFGQTQPTNVRWHFVAIVMLGVFLLTSFTLWLNVSGENELSSIPVNEREIKSLAVLPLKQILGDDSGLSTGLADSLISRLGRLNRFAVRPLTAVDDFEDSGVDAVEFGRRLAVDAVLEGSFQKDNDLVRVNLRLIDVRDGAVFWTEKFDENEGDLFKLQDAISSKVAQFVLKKITKKEQELLARNSTENKEAFMLYMLGLESWLRRDGSNAKEFYEKALSLDPNFAPAYVGIADYYSLSGDTENAEKMLDKALEIDPTLHNAIATKGFIRMFHHWDWMGAEALFRNAIKIAPNSSKARHWYGVYLCFQKKFAEAEAEMETALNLDPSSLVIQTDIAELYYFQKKYEEAEKRLDGILRIDEDFHPALGRRRWVRHMRNGSFIQDSFRSKLAKLKLRGGSADTARIRKYGSLIKRNDKREMTEEFLKEIDWERQNSKNKYWVLAGNLMVAEKDQEAIEMLENSLESKEFMLPFIAIDPLWDDLRSNPRFTKVVRGMNLPA